MLSPTLCYQLVVRRWLPLSRRHTPVTLGVWRLNGATTGPRFAIVSSRASCYRSFDVSLTIFFHLRFISLSRLCHVEAGESNNNNKLALCCCVYLSSVARRNRPQCANSLTAEDAQVLLNRNPHATSAPRRDRPPLPSQKRPYADA